MQVLSGHTDLVRGLAYAPDGATLASAGRDRSVRLWDLAAGAERARLLGHTNGVHAVAFHPDGATLSSGGDRTVRLWEATSARPLAVLRGHTATVLGLAYSPDGRTLASAAAHREGRKYTGTHSQVILWDLDTLRPKSVVTMTAWLGAWCVDYNPDGTQLALGTSQSVVARWFPNALPAECTYDARLILKDPGSPYGPSNRFVPENHWVPPGVESPLPLYQNAAVVCVAHAPDGRTLAATGGRWVKLWDTETGRRAVTMKGHKETVQSIAFTPDGDTLVSAAVDGTIRFWDVVSGGERACFDTGVGRKVESLAVSPDGMTLAAGGERDVVIWDLDERH